MKILIITDAWTPQVNGVVRTYEHLSEALVAKGHEVRILPPNEFFFKVPLPTYPEIKLAIFAYYGIYKTVKKFKPDAIHIATEGPLGWAARRFCLRNNLPFTTSYHTHFPEYIAKRFGYFMPSLHRPVHEIAVKHLRRFHNASQTILTASASLDAQLREWGFETPMKRLTRGIDTDVFKLQVADVYQGLKGPIALYVGRIAIEKNLEAFLEMDWPGSKVLIGEGPTLKDLKSRYPEAVFLGKKTGEELAQHFAAADVFVFPSKTDTFGIVLLEALACGLPVAAYPVTGPVDIITEPGLGVLNEDLGAAAKAALTCGNPADRVGHIKNYYTWDIASRQFLDAMCPITVDLDEVEA